MRLNPLGLALAIMRLSVVPLALRSFVLLALLPFFLRNLCFLDWELTGNGCFLDYVRVSNDHTRNFGGGLN